MLSPGRETLTFGSLVEQVDETRIWLNAGGVGHGDRIALIAPRGPETAVAALGIACCATCVPINPFATAAECRTILAATRAKAVLAPAVTDSPARDAARELGLAWFNTSVPNGAPAGRFFLDGEHTTGAARSGLPTAEDVALVLCTSGTTSRPKLVPSEHGHLVARMAKLCRLLELTSADRCLNVMPLCYANGLYSGTITPLTAGGSVIYPVVFEIESFFRCLLDLAPTWYTGGATYQQVIVDWLRRRPDAAAGHSLRFVRSGSSPLPAQVHDELERLLDIPVTEGYAASEVGVITANPPCSRRKRGTVGLPGDEDVAVMDERGSPLPPGEVGEVWARGPTVFNGYEDDPEANREAFRNGWFRTGDLGSFDVDGYLTLTGRLKEMINRGGEKVSPAEVDAALLEHPAVHEAAAFGIPHPTLGEEVAAAVKLRRAEDVSESDLRRFLLERLTAFKVPRRIEFVAELPKGPTGKPLRGALAELLRPHTQPDSAVSPEDTPQPLETILLKVWRQALGRDDLGLDDDFFLLGGNSLSAVDLLTGIEEELRLQMPLSSLIETPTVREFARCLQKQEWLDRHAATTGDLIGVNLHGSQTPLFAVCGRYGHAFRFLPVGRELGGDQPLYGLQPPDMDWEAAGCHTIPQIAAHYIDRITSVQSQGPYRLFGSSFGGLVVFEIALQLQAAGQEIELLAVLDSEPTIVHWDGNTDAPDQARLDALQRRLARAEMGAPDRIKAAGIRTARIHVAARGAYVMDKRYRGEIVYFYCSSHLVRPGVDRRRLWHASATEGIRLLPMPGRHGLFHKEPQFSALCNALRACLNGVPPAGKDPASVFERRYELVTDSTGEFLRGDDGSVHSVAPVAAHGKLDRIRITEQELVLVGWACDVAGNPATSLLVFLDGHYVGHGACGLESRAARQGLSRPSLRYAGFRLHVPRASNQPRPRPRVFVLCPQGRAYEVDNRVSDDLNARYSLRLARRLYTFVARKLLTPLRQSGDLLRRPGSR